MPDAPLFPAPLFTVTGVDPDNIGYRVGVYAKRPRGEVTAGVVMGSVNALILLRSHNGLDVSLTPTGPTVTVDISDPESVLAALHALTTVTGVEGDDIPDVLPDSEDGIVY